MTGAEQAREVEAPTWLELGGLVVVVAGAAVAVLSLVSAWAGVHNGLLALVLGLGATAALVVVAARRATWAPAPWSWVPAVALAAVLVVAATQFFPGFPLAAKNQDPGVYVNHAVAIAREGSDSIPDPVFATGAEVRFVGGEPLLVTEAGDLPWHRRTYRGFPADPDDDERLLPSFFHLWPATLATAHDLGGTRALYNLTPLCALGAVALLFLATRRALGLVAATVAAGLLSVNMLEVWQAKLPTAEALSQFLYCGALLAVALALSTRWRVAAGVAGALVGMGFVARPEGLYVAAMAAGVLALLWAFDAFDRRAQAFAAGMAPPLLLGAYQAYLRASDYSANQGGLPSAPLVVAGVVALAVGAAGLRWLRGQRFPVVERVRALDHARTARVVGLALAALFGVFLLIAWFRPQLFGQNVRLDKEGELSRGYDELNLRRLTWFVTLPGLLAAWGALVAGVWRRWSLATWAVVLPGVLVAPVLIWEPRIAPALMWWGRRYVPMVLVALLVLVGAAAATVWDLRSRHRTVLRVGVVVVVIGLAGLMFRQSNDLWGHREYGGSLGVVGQLEDVADGRAVAFVWQAQTEQTANFGVTPLTWMGLPSLTGPPQPTAESLVAIQQALGGRPLYLVTQGPAAPPRAEPVLELERRIVTELSVFERTLEERPTATQQIPVDLSVWRVVAP